MQADTEKKIKAVAVVHNETATGANRQTMRNPDESFKNLIWRSICRLSLQSLSACRGAPRN